jgi:fumarylacetoacetate (FAA) hydrolase
VEPAVKLASHRSGRDGQLLVVSRDLRRAVPAARVAATLQAALDDWEHRAPALAELYAILCRDELPDAFPLDPRRLAAPLPRAYQWLDGSTYLNHVRLVRRSRGAEMPPGAEVEPLMYQGGSDVLLGPHDDIRAGSEDWGIDFEAEVVVVTGDVALGSPPERCAEAIRLVGLVNDVSLRNLIPAELAKGLGFLHGKPPTAFSPVLVTPDELGHAWKDGKLHLPLRVHRGEELFGAPDAGTDMAFGFPELIAHAARTRPLTAGTIVGSGTVSNRDASVGSCCIAERRALEILEHGEARTPYLRFGERVRIEMLDGRGESLFGAIEQAVVAADA